MVSSAPMLAGPALWLSLTLAPSSPASEEVPVRAPRGNEVLVRRRGLVWSVAAMPRLSLLIGDGRRASQPVGFGVGLQFRLWALHITRVRFGLGLDLGHSRFLGRSTVTGIDGTSTRRWAALGHSDFTLGPSVQVVAGPLLLEGTFGAGVGVSTLRRPLPHPAEAADPQGDVLVSTEEDASDTSAVIRGGLQLGIPIRRNQGISIGAAVHKYFSRTLVVATDDLIDVDATPNTNPFDLVLDVVVGYQMWF
jgi:hypothetical protein